MFHQAPRTVLLKLIFRQIWSAGGVGTGHNTTDRSYMSARHSRFLVGRGDARAGLSRVDAINIKYE